MQKLYATQNGAVQNLPFHLVLRYSSLTIPSSSESSAGICSGGSLSARRILSAKAEASLARTSDFSAALSLSDQAQAISLSFSLVRRIISAGESEGSSISAKESASSICS